MKRNIYRLLIPGFIFIIFMGIATAQPLDSIAAVVNDSIITNAQLTAQVNSVTARLQASNMAIPSQAALRSQVLQQMIDEQLQLQMAARIGIKVSEAQLTQALQRIAQQNNMTVNQLLQSAQSNGFTESSFKKEIKKEILIQTVQQQMVSSRISLT